MKERAWWRIWWGGCRRWLASRWRNPATHKAASPIAAVPDLPGLAEDVVQGIDRASAAMEFLADQLARLNEFAAGLEAEGYERMLARFASEDTAPALRRLETQAAALESAARRLRRRIARVQFQDQRVQPWEGQEPDQKT